MIDDTASAQYSIELAATGMEDGPPSSIGAADRLDKLRRHRAAWDELKWAQNKSVPMSTGQVWELYGNVLAQAQGDRTIIFRQLPSRYRGIEEREWTISNLGFDIRDFGMEPSQDLLVLIEKPGPRYGLAEVTIIGSFDCFLYQQVSSRR